MNPVREEIHDTEGACWFQVMGASPSSTFLPLWYRFAPGFTLRVRPAPDMGPVCYIRVSPYARILVTDTPP
jgi:hypothetical protein